MVARTIKKIAREKTAQAASKRREAKATHKVAKAVGKATGAPGTPRSKAAKAQRNKAVKKAIRTYGRRRDLRQSK